MRTALVSIGIAAGIAAIVAIAVDDRSDASGGPAKVVTLTQPATAAAPQQPVADAAAVRATTLADVARRLYGEEVGGATVRRQVLRIGHDRTLLAALERNDPAAVRAETLRQLFLPGKHVVRLRVVRGSRSLGDVGGRFVVAGAQEQLRAPNGASLGELQASIQDVIGFVKLTHRLTGADVVVRGSASQVEAWPASAAQLSLPASGGTAFAGHTYDVSSFRAVGFGGEPLTIWILTR
jgi:hypothetical protein